MIISVVIPVLNRASLIEAAIRSLLRQQGPFTMDVVVVDDGSTDGTGELVSAFAKKDARVRVFHQTNLGIAAARNAGLANIHPNARFVSFLDSDDLCLPERFQRDLPLFIKCPNLAATYGRALVTDRYNATQSGPATDARLADVMTIHVGCALIRRKVLDHVGVFDTRFVQGEDTDFLLRLFETDLPVLQTNTPCLTYLRHPGNITNQSEISRQFFELAIQESQWRQAQNPAIRLRLPQFDFDALHETGLYPTLDADFVETALGKIADGYLGKEASLKLYSV